MQMVMFLSCKLGSRRRSMGSRRSRRRIMGALKEKRDGRKDARKE